MNTEIKKFTMSDLDNLIDDYALANAEKNDLDKICKQKGAEIKTILQENDTTEYSTDHYKAKLQTRKSEDMNEEALIEIARKHNLAIIKTKEYIDFDELEKIIYAGQVPNSILMEMDNCKTTKETIALTVKPIKRG